MWETRENTSYATRSEAGKLRPINIDCHSKALAFFNLDLFQWFPEKCTFCISCERQIDHRSSGHVTTAMYVFNLFEMGHYYVQVHTYLMIKSSHYAVSRFFHFSPVLYHTPPSIEFIRIALLGVPHFHVTVPWWSQFKVKISVRKSDWSKRRLASWESQWKKRWWEVKPYIKTHQLGECRFSNSVLSAERKETTRKDWIEVKFSVLKNCICICKICIISRLIQLTNVKYNAKVRCVVFYLFNLPVNWQFTKAWLSNVT